MSALIQRLQNLEDEVADLRAKLQETIAEKAEVTADRDDALARVAELIEAIADDSRNAMLPPPPVAVESGEGESESETP